MSPRRRLLRWASWFSVVNAAFLGVVGLRYLWYYATLGATNAWVYAVLAYIGHLSALAYVPFLVLLVPLIVLIPRPRVVLPLGVCLASAGLSVLLLDSLLFAENRYHLNVLTFSLLEPQTWAFLASYFVVGVAIEAMVAAWVWRRTEFPSPHRIGRYLALILVSCFVASHLIHAWASAHYYVPVTAFTRYLPFYHPLRDARLLARLGLIDRLRAREQGLVAALGEPPGGELNYPLSPLRCEASSPGLNVVLIVIDAMRADSLTPVAAPRLAEFARSAVRFDDHFSGGNSSRPGVFSMFYGLPATYWDAFATRLRPPLLMELFGQQRYQLGLFVSSPLYRLVELDRTVFARVPNLRRETSSRFTGRSSGRDQTLTAEWYEWLDRREQSRPFFGFLYYNAAVALEPPDDYPPVVSLPAGASTQARRYARYLTAVHFLDGLVGGVLDDLGRRKLLERTVVIVTSDHGIEFDESGLGFVGHGTAYSDYQIRTPLVVRWPGRPAGRVARRTSHNDIVPTLLARLFGCTNPPTDYASGHDLFSDAQWDWLIVASYREYAVVDPERVTIIYPRSYEIRDRSYRLVAKPTVPREALRAALQEMSRFYR